MNRILGTSALALGLWACTEAEMPQASDGRALYDRNCAACHGADARGAGPLARELGLAAPDLTTLAADNGGTFPRIAVLSKIDGYRQGSGDAPGMPEFGALFEGDLVPLETGDGVMTPTPRKLVALVEYLESIQQAP